MDDDVVLGPWFPLKARSTDQFSDAMRSAGADVDYARKSIDDSCVHCPRDVIHVDEVMDCVGMSKNQRLA